MSCGTKTATLELEAAATTASMRTETRQLVLEKEEAKLVQIGRNSRSEKRARIGSQRANNLFSRGAADVCGANDDILTVCRFSRPEASLN